MQNYFLVGIGAAFGGIFRYWLSGAVQRKLPFTFPLGTLTVNILGSFLLGFIIFFLDSRELISSEMRIFLTIGFCGGFTTFSTFSFETINLIRDAEYFYAFLNAGLNLFLTLSAVILAYYLSKIL
ncbi:MAG TPA: fluoride efflux transporter CrcB [bacterium]|nr:fluoride efflux transporter CrcB [bacterium]HPN43881.1 fluoride efflux transporter CrcB [bacterium]